MVDPAQIQALLAVMRESGAGRIKLKAGDLELEAAFAPVEQAPEPPRAGDTSPDFDDDVPWNARDPIAEANRPPARDSDATS